MRARLARNAKAVEALGHANKQIRQIMMNRASRDLVLTLVECATDIIKGKISLTPNQLKELRPYEHMLKQFIP